MTRKATRVIVNEGYVALYQPDHPMADQLGWVREHRMVAYDQGWLTGRDDPRQVHHRNHDRADNRPENLEVLTAAEHRSRHRPGRRVSDSVLRNLHAEGLSTVAIGGIVGMDPAGVWRRLQEMGLEANGYQRGWSVEEAVRLASAGGRPAWIAELLGTTENAVRIAVKKAGGVSFPSGRPKVGDREAWYERLGKRGQR